MFTKTKLIAGLVIVGVLVGGSLGLDAVQKYFMKSKLVGVWVPVSGSDQVLSFKPNGVCSRKGAVNMWRLEGCSWNYAILVESGTNNVYEVTFDKEGNLVRNVDGKKTVHARMDFSDVKKKDPDFDEFTILSK